MDFGGRGRGFRYYLTWERRNAPFLVSVNLPKHSQKSLGCAEPLTARLCPLASRGVSRGCDHMRLGAEGTRLLELSQGVFVWIKFHPLSGAAFYLNYYLVKLDVFYQVEITASPTFLSKCFRIKWCEVYVVWQTSSFCFKYCGGNSFYVT